MKWLLVGLIDELCAESGIDVAKSALVKQEFGKTGDGKPDPAATFPIHIASGLPCYASILRAALRSWWAMQRELFGDARANMFDVGVSKPGSNEPSCCTTLVHRVDRPPPFVPIFVPPHRNL